MKKLSLAEDIFVMVFISLSVGEWNVIEMYFENKNLQSVKRHKMTN